MLNDGLLASSVGSYRPLCSHRGPHWASIAVGSNDLARLSRPGVNGAAVDDAVCAAGGVAVKSVAVVMFD